MYSRAPRLREGEKASGRVRSRAGRGPRMWGPGEVVMGFTLMDVDVGTDTDADASKRD